VTNSYKKGYKGEKDWRELCEKNGQEIIWNNEDPDYPDVTINHSWKILKSEVKSRKAVPKSIYKWLDEKDANILASRRVEGRGHPARDWLVTMRAELFFEMLEELKKE